MTKKPVNDCTEAELKLIRAISPHWYDLVTGDTEFNTPTVFRILVEKCFIENMEGPAVEALRRAYGAIFKCKPYRHTPEFDKLCEF